MARLQLRNVTLVAIDCTPAPARTLRALTICEHYADFGDLVFITTHGNVTLAQRRACRIIATNAIRSRIDHSAFVITRLNSLVHTPFALLVQHDGFILNPLAWHDDYLRFDYVGAPWWYNDGFNVGNGGFSIRSKRLLHFLQADHEICSFYPEDDIICRVHGPRLRRLGFSFAPEALASHFSIEGTLRCPTNKPVKYGSVWTHEFGFHGLPRTDIGLWPDRRLFFEPRRDATAASFTCAPHNSQK